MADANLTGIRRRDRQRVSVTVARPAPTPTTIGGADAELPTGTGIPTLRRYSSYGSGSQSLTTSIAAILPGGSAPTLILTVAGTYLIFGSVQLNASAATVTTQTASVELARQNNTPATLPFSSITVDLRVMTAASETVAAIAFPCMVYTTTNDDDEIIVQGLISGALGAGTIDAVNAGLVALRIS